MQAPASRGQSRRPTSKGESTRFYFIYAGHGDVADGEGVLELEDDRIDGSFIEQPSSRGSRHAPSTSCSTAAIRSSSSIPASPGVDGGRPPRHGLRFFGSAPRGGALSLHQQRRATCSSGPRSNRGCSATRFVRGFSGGADVNADGKVSYQELAGFVERANTGIVRPAIAPSSLLPRAAGRQSRQPLPDRRDGRADASILDSAETGSGSRTKPVRG